MPRVRLTLLPALLLLAAPSTASAITEPPGAPQLSPSQARAALSDPEARSAVSRGQTRGVRARRGRDGVVVSFSGPARGKFRRAVAGRRVNVTCTDLEREGLGLSFATETSVTLRAPRSRPVLRTGLGGRFDYCEIIRPGFTRRPRRNVTVRVSPKTLATDALTDRGTVFLDERQRAVLLSSILTLAGLTADSRDQDTYPESGPFVERVDGPLVALDSPLATPPKGKVGYFSDGGLHIAAVTLSARGRRLFILYNEDVVTSNVLEYLGD